MRFRARAAALRRSPAHSATIALPHLRQPAPTALGLSTQDTAYQREAAERLHLPFPILSDCGALRRWTALKLPVMLVDGATLLGSAWR